MNLAFCLPWSLGLFFAVSTFGPSLLRCRLAAAAAQSDILSIYLVYLRTSSNYLCIYASMYLCIDLCIDLSIYLSIYLSIHLSIYSLLDILCKKYEYSGFSVQNHKRLEKTKTQRSLTRIGIVMWSGQPKNLPKRGSLGK